MKLLTKVGQIKIPQMGQTDLPNARGPGNWITRFIRYWTGSEFSHVTLVFSNGEAFGASGRDRPACQFKWLLDFGVPGRDRVLIRRTITYQAVDSADLWTLVPLDVTPAQERRVRRACERWDGTKFDWLGLACHLLPRRKKRKPVTRTAQVIEIVPWRKRKRIYCSNLAASLLLDELGRGLGIGRRMTPGQLHAAFAPLYPWDRRDSQRNFSSCCSIAWMHLLSYGIAFRTRGNFKFIMLLQIHPKFGTITEVPR